MATTKAEVILSAVDKTKTAFASVSRSLDGLSSNITSFTGKFAGITAVVAGAVAGFAALENIKVIALLDQLDDLAEKSGVSVEKLSELRFAGESTGTNFENLTSGLGRLSKQMAAAAGGSKEAAATFQALGVEVTNTDGTLRSSDDVLRDVATRFAGYEDGAAKAALAQRLFGKSGAEMIPLLNQGAAGIARLADEARALGVIYDTKTAKAAADFNDNLTKIKLASEAAGVSIAGPLIQSLARLSAEFLEAKKNGGLFAAGMASYRAGVSEFWSGQMFGGGAPKGKTTAEIQAFVNSRGGPAAGGGRGFTNPQVAAPVVRDEPKPPKTPRGGASREAKDVEAAAKRYLENLDKQLERTEKLSQVELALAEIRRIQAEGGVVTEAMKQQILLKAADIDATKALTEAEKKRSDEQDEAQKRLFQSQDEAKKIFESTRTPLEEYGAAIDKLNDLYDQGLLSADTYSRAILKQGVALEEAQKRAKEAANQQDEFTKRMAENIQDSIGDGLTKILDGNFKDIDKNFSKMLQRMAVEAAAAQLSRAMFGDLIKDGEGEGFFGGLLKQLGGALSGKGGRGRSSGGDALEGLLASNSAFGTGGGSSGGGWLASLFDGLASFDVGTDYVPEDMIAKIHKGEKIIPAAQNKRGAGGDTYISVPVSGAVDHRTRLQIAGDISLEQRRAGRLA